MAGGGGAWKVAFADFVTAMMALFMLLWILNQDEKVKGEVQQYFNTRFKSVTKMSVGIIPIQNADLIEAKRAVFDNASAIDLQFIRRINEDIIKMFADNPNFIDMQTYHVEVTSEGLLIEFFNDPNRRLFDGPTAKLTDFGDAMFEILSFVLARHKSTRVEVEGHTARIVELDGEAQDTWVLSTDRALMARKTMVYYAMKPEQVIKVAGYSSSRPLKNYSHDLNDSHHDRVTIMVRAGNQY
ncbi:MAG: OmpA/MotB family protein [Verrucomicrobiia bacterium]|jgi:chemotaxis protein MotB|tara:strand:- start:435 stop:1157 length:723 start_codon:yes stop_codon:yes gene_type:complete